MSSCHIVNLKFLVRQTLKWAVSIVWHIERTQEIARVMFGFIFAVCLALFSIIAIIVLLKIYPDWMKFVDFHRKMTFVCDWFWIIIGKRARFPQFWNILIYFLFDHFWRVSCFDVQQRRWAISIQFQSGDSGVYLLKHNHVSHHEQNAKIILHIQQHSQYNNNNGFKLDLVIMTCSWIK